MKRLPHKVLAVVFLCIVRAASLSAQESTERGEFPNFDPFAELSLDDGVAGISWKTEGLTRIRLGASSLWDLSPPTFVPGIIVDMLLEVTVMRRAFLFGGVRGRMHLFPETGDFLGWPSLQFSSRQLTFIAGPLLGVGWNVTDRVSISVCWFLWIDLRTNWTGFVTGNLLHGANIGVTWKRVTRTGR